MTVLGIDPGSRRVGVAVSDPGETLAVPLKVLQRADDDSYVDDLVAIVEEKQVTRVVVGLPRRLDGSDGPEAKAAIRLAGTLKARTGLPVHLLDERFTTSIAEAALRGHLSARKQRPVVDKVAASLLLQDFLDLGSSRTEPV